MYYLSFFYICQYIFVPYVIFHIKYRIFNIDQMRIVWYNVTMSLKKSLFGELCRRHRRNMTEQEMAKKILEMENSYKLGKKPAKSKQPLVSQFEREFDLKGIQRKQHRDPPLDYVETCANLFELSPPDKYDLFVAAMQSSKKIIFDKKNIEGHIEIEIINIFLSLIFSGKELGNIVKTHLEKKAKTLTYVYPDNDKDKQLLLAWEELSKAAQQMINAVRQNHHKYSSNDSG